MIVIKRSSIQLKADPRKVVLRFLNFGNPARFEPVVRYVLDLSTGDAKEQLDGILADFKGRHPDLKAAFLENFGKLAAYVPGDPPLPKKLLIGACFTHEYSIEAAALFNPSIVPHPDQSGLADGELRFILSLRATGEGHISSITFQTGVIEAGGEIRLDPRPATLTCGQYQGDVQFDKSFALRRMDLHGGITSMVSNLLPDRFSLREALVGIAGLEKKHYLNFSPDRDQITRFFDLHYDLVFPEDTPVGSRVIFPRSGTETNGMEDARFVAFSEGDERIYLATYTAYNGQAIRPQLIETRDFRHFRIRPLWGKAASDKGMALFPEKINGRYAMIGRQGGRSLSIMYSDDLHFWETYQPLQHPERNWEILQIGNCGSPIKTPQGWLLLTHAVGPMRKYVLSFTLLDLQDPSIVLASLEEPFMSPEGGEREGYVPNVLYTCGLIRHGENLVIPYAMSDSAVGFAVAKMEEVLGELRG